MLTRISNLTVDQFSQYVAAVVIRCFVRFPIRFSSSFHQVFIKFSFQGLLKSHIKLQSGLLLFITCHLVSAILHQWSSNASSRCLSGFNGCVILHHFLKDSNNSHQLASYLASYLQVEIGNGICNASQMRQRILAMKSAPGARRKQQQISNSAKNVRKKALEVARRALTKRLQRKTHLCGQTVAGKMLIGCRRRTRS